MRVVLSDVIEDLETFAPLELADSWDRPGLQVGDPRSPVRRILVALDPSPLAVAEAVRRQAQLLVTHHPLLLDPLHRIDLSRSPGCVLADAIRAGLSIYSAHTNLDRAEGGVNDRLAEMLGVEQVEPLVPGGGLCKVAVTVPLGYEDRVLEALASSGAGRVGGYERCSFACRGEGTFVTPEGASPFLGRAGTRSRVDETRLEMTVPRIALKGLQRALRDVHPYEEPAVDIYLLEGDTATGGLGRVGVLARPLPLEQWCGEACRRLGAQGARFVGDPERIVERVALCGGSGASLWPEALAKRADVLVTGDVRYHAALDARDAGLALVDLGHGPTEQAAVDVMECRLQDWSGRVGAGLEILTYRETDPFSWVSA
jgi:dinuclear metal center YbgI/SA1388 family protein